MYYGRLADSVARLFSQAGYVVQFDIVFIVVCHH
jgi:uncharacterized membrane protein